MVSKRDASNSIDNIVAYIEQLEEDKQELRDANVELEQKLDDLEEELRDVKLQLEG